MIIWKKNTLALTVASLLLTGCFSDDKEAIAEAGADISIKERRAQTLSGATATGEGSVTIAWTQVSGPELIITDADTLTPHITAPSVDNNAEAVLRLTVTDSKGQVANDDLTVSVTNNILPQLTSQPDPVMEKTAVEITANLTDDGEITTISWQQTAGPTVELTGDNSATVSFTTPAVTEVTTLSFLLSVTDDDAETAEIELHVDVQPNLVALSLTGQVSGADFNGGDALLTGAQEEVTAEVDANGAFNLDFHLDDDLLDSVVTVQVSAAENSRIQYSAIYSGFAEDAAAATAATMSYTASDVTNYTTDGSNTVHVNAVSTALYSLLVTANGGEVPSNIEQLIFIEKTVDADELTEAAAVVKILTDNPDITLPEGITNITALLVDVAAYNSMVTQIETQMPGAIEETVVAIIADPTLTPPVTADTIAPVYYQTFAAAPGFLSRGGDQWQFNQDGTGSLSNRFGGYDFTWAVDDAGNIAVNYSVGQIREYYSGVAVGVGGLTQEQVNWLLADNITQVRVEANTNASTAKRIATGQHIDSFNIESSTVTRVLPIQTSQGLVETAGVNKVTNGNYLMRKEVSDSHAFTAADMPGDWAMNSYYMLEFHDRVETQFFLDVLQFNEGGTGTSQDTERTFTWQVNNGVLNVLFSDSTELHARIIDVSGSDYQLFTVAKDDAGNVIAADADYGFKVQEDVSVNWITGSENYWQTMINSWDKHSWDNGRLLLCNGDPKCEQQYPFFTAFGWQFLDGGSGNRLAASYQDVSLPPLFEPRLDSLSWSQSGETELTIDFNIQQREWTLLKTEPGILGTRIYVKEQASLPEYGLFIGNRIGMYEQISTNYWNDSFPENAVNAASVKALQKLTKRIVINATVNNATVN